MKFGTAKLPKTFYKNTEKKFKHSQKKKNNKELSLIENRKVTTNFCYHGRKKVLSLGKFSAVATGGLAPHFG